MRKRIANCQASPRRLLSILIIFLFITLEFYYVDGHRSRSRDIRKNNKVRHKLKCGNNGIKRKTMLFNHRSENFIENRRDKVVETRSSYVNGTAYNVLEIESCGTNETLIRGSGRRLLLTKRYRDMQNTKATRIRMRFVWTGGPRYLCFSKKGRMTTRHNGNLQLCQFYEVPAAQWIHVARKDSTVDGTFVYYSVQNIKWALGFRKSKKPIKGRAAYTRSQRYFDTINSGRHPTTKVINQFKVAQFSKRPVPSYVESSLRDLHR